jgi:hypothetical protein
MRPKSKHEYKSFFGILDCKIFKKKRIASNMIVERAAVNLFTAVFLFTLIRVGVFSQMLV